MTPNERLEAIGALAARDPRIEAAFNLLDGKLDAAIRAAETELIQMRDAEAWERWRASVTPAGLKALTDTRNP